jgi:uncharacterized protein YeeX (DUF496 family)
MELGGVLSVSQGKVVSVDVYGMGLSALKSFKEELLTLGYALRFSADISASNNPPYPDVCIIDVSMLSSSKEIIQALPFPYLVSGMNLTQTHHQSSELLDNSVGFINGNPSVADICVNIRLGMLWNKERANFSKRAQDIDQKITNNRITGVAIGILMHKTGLSEEQVLDVIKSVSRDKQRRMVDVSIEVISTVNQPESENSELDTVVKLKAWLGSKIPRRVRG